MKTAGWRSLVMGSVLAFVGAQTAQALTLTANTAVGGGVLSGTNSSGSVENIRTNVNNAALFWWADTNGDNNANDPASAGLNMNGKDLTRITDTVGITLNLNDGTANGVVTNGGNITTAHSVSQHGTFMAVCITNAAAIQLNTIDTRNLGNYYDSGDIILANVGNVMVSNLYTATSNGSHRTGNILVSQTGNFTASDVQSAGNSADPSTAPYPTISLQGNGSGTCGVGRILHYGKSIGDITIANYQAVTIGTTGIDARCIGVGVPCNVFIRNIGTGGVSVVGSILASSPIANSVLSQQAGVVITNIAGSVAVGNIDTHGPEWGNTGWQNVNNGAVNINAVGRVQTGNLVTYFGTTYATGGYNAGNIAIASSTGSVTVGSIDTRQAANAANSYAGSASLTAYGDLAITGSVIAMSAPYGGTRQGILALTTTVGSAGTIYIGSQNTDVFDVNLVQYAAFNSATGTNYLSGIVSNFNIASSGGSGTLTDPFITTQTNNTVRAPTNHYVYYKGADDNLNAYLSNAVFRLPNLAGVKGAGGLLMVKPPLVAISDLYATNITGSAADMVGNLVTGVAPVTVTCYWGTNDGGRTASAWMTNTVVGTPPLGIVTNSIASGLNGSTVYYFRFFASNAVAQVWANKAASFSTLGTPAVDNGSGASTTQTNATLRGNLTVGNPQPSVWIYWGTADGGTTQANWNQPPLFIGQPSVPSVFSTNVYGLLPGHTYWYRCYSSNTASGAWAPTSTNFTTALATLTINDASVLEGSLAGPPNQALFTVTLSTTNDASVTVNYATSNGTAIAGTDYTPSSGTLTIPSGSLSGQISVSVIGNDLFNPNKIFYVNLSSPSYATLTGGRSQGIGTILNDDFNLYVKPVSSGGSDANNGATWATAFSTIQHALDTIAINAATNGVVYIAKTTAPSTYAPASEAFTNSVSVQLLGGYNTGTGLPDGMSEVTNSVGIGLNLQVAKDAVNTSNIRVGQFTIANFTITNTAAQSVYTLISQRTPTATILSNCVLATTSITVPAVGLDVGDTATGPFYGDTQTAVISGCRIYTPVASPYAAVASGDMNGYLNQANWTHLGTFLVRDSQISASADGGGGRNRSGAIFAGNNSFTMINSAVTNLGAGLAVYAGYTYSAIFIFTNFINNCAFDSAGGGVRFDAANFSANGVGSFVLNSSIIARGASVAGLEFTDWVSTTGDSGLADVTLTNVSIVATNTGSIGLYLPMGGNGGSDDLVIRDSSIYGRESAFCKQGGTMGGAATLYSLHSTFSAGAQDGSVNSTNIVLNVVCGYGETITLDRTVVRNGFGGVSLSELQYTPVTVRLLNSVITDQSGYGVRVKANSYGGGDKEYVIATNCTFSNLGGPAVSFGDNTLGIRSGTFAYCAFAPGANGGNASATNFVNEVATGTLTLTGYTNAFYAYGSLTNNATAIDTSAFLANTFSSAGDPLFKADGYHLQTTSPLIDTYVLSPACLTNDIDGELRPLGKKGDIGADEVLVPPFGTTVFFR